MKSIQQAKPASQLSTLSISKVETPFSTTEKNFPGDALGDFVRAGGIDVLVHGILSVSDDWTLVYGLRATSHFWKRYVERYMFSRRLIPRIALFVLPGLARRVMTTPSRGYFRSVAVREKKVPATREQSSAVVVGLSTELRVTGTPNWFTFPRVIHASARYNDEDATSVVSYPAIEATTVHPRNSNPLIIFIAMRRSVGITVLPLAIDIYSGAILWQTRAKRHYTEKDFAYRSRLRGVGNVYTDKFSFRKYFTTNLYPKTTT